MCIVVCGCVHVLVACSYWMLQSNKSIKPIQPNQSNHWSNHINQSMLCVCMLHVPNACVVCLCMCMYTSCICACMYVCMYVCKTPWLYTIHKCMHVYIRCALSVCVCEMHAHAFALHLCIAHLCVHLSGNDNDCHNSNTTSTTAKCGSVPSSTCKEHNKGNPWWWKRAQEPVMVQE